MILDRLVSPGAVGRDAEHRLARALAAWRQLDRSAPRSGPPADPASGRFRCWLAEVEDALAIAKTATSVLRIAPGKRRASASWSRLVDLVADEGILARLAPHGRIPDGFPTRALAESRKRLRACARKAGRGPWTGTPEPEVGAVLVERGLTIRPAGRDARFEARVVRALALLDAAWPEGAAMVRSRTWRIVPVTAWATVSYSSARQPGIAYINVKSAPDLRLAEDLAHEAAHMRLHEIEAVHELIAKGAREAADGSEPRFYSPWRREWRPLRGLVHAACTFTVGAIFFERMLAAAARIHPSRRVWLAMRLLEERASVAIALGILARARRRRMLTRDGARVVAAVTRDHGSLAGAARKRAAWLRRSPEGRAALLALERRLASLSKRPTRWSWTA